MNKLANYQVNSKSSKSRTLYVVVTCVIIVFAVGAWLIYNSQHKKVVSLESSLKNANSNVEKTKKALTEEASSSSKAFLDLQKKYQDALDKNSASNSTQNTSSAQSQEDLDLTVVKAVTATIDANSTEAGIAIKLTLKNTSDTAITEGPTNYKIKDAKNNEYALHFLSWGGFGKDFNPILVNEIQPGQSLTGSIFITIADANVTDYTLFIGSHSYKVSATKLANYPVID